MLVRTLQFWRSTNATFASRLKTKVAHYRQSEIVDEKTPPLRQQGEVLYPKESG
jgi:hypothetical protein